MRNSRNSNARERFNVADDFVSALLDVRSVIHSNKIFCPLAEYLTSVLLTNARVAKPRGKKELRFSCMQNHNAIVQLAAKGNKKEHRKKNNKKKDTK
jgi:hypothetical protein